MSFHYTKDHPFLASLIRRERLTSEGSLKNTQHLELDVTGSSFAYEPGDSLGVYPTNDAILVDQVIHALGYMGAELVAHPKTQEVLSLRELLMHHVSLTHVSRELLQLFVPCLPSCAQQELELLLDPDNEAAFKEYHVGRDVLETLQDFKPVGLPLEPFIKSLRRLLPRLYSIASSPLLYPDHIHLTVGITQQMIRGRLRQGVATHYLGCRVPLEEPQIPVFLAKSHFRLPEDDTTDVIMIGPGTGIAPFRAFLQERQARGAQGRNALFFGEQHEATDFLYKSELLAYVKSGFLTHLSLAFSRDQEAKIYVQHRIAESASLIWDWLQSGAHVYVCGDAHAMAKDVDHALHQLVQAQGGLSEAAAQAYWKEMKRSKRYQRDVY